MVHLNIVFSGQTKADLKLHMNSREAAHKQNEKLELQEEEIKRIKLDMGELMHVYDDIQVNIAEK